MSDFVRAEKHLIDEQWLVRIKMCPLPQAYSNRRCISLLLSPASETTTTSVPDIGQRQHERGRVGRGVAKQVQRRGRGNRPVARACVVVAITGDGTERQQQPPARDRVEEERGAIVLARVELCGERLEKERRDIPTNTHTHEHQVNMEGSFCTRN